MFRSISRVFFLLICATGTTAAMAANEKIDIDIPISDDCPVAIQNGAVNTIYAVNCATTATKVCYGNNGDGFASQCVVGCKTCQSGYTLTNALGTADKTTSDEFPYKCTFSYKTCEKKRCTLACPRRPRVWRLASERGNYESSYITMLNLDTCTCDKIYSYRCAAGYYNSRGSSAVVSSPSSLSCTKCPTTLDGYSTSEAENNVGVKSCYMRKGDSYSHKVKEGEKTNTIGKYRLSVDCYYDQQSN